MSEIIDRGAEAMRAKRRELIAQPLDLIWPELMQAAVAAMRDPDWKMTAAAREASFPYYNIFGIMETHDKDAAADEIWRLMIDEALTAAAPIPQHGEKP